VIHRIVEHYKDHAATIGYQIDNATRSADAASHNVQVGFVTHLQEKFKSIDRLNEAWGLNYWGQRPYDWSEVPPRDRISNLG
jgi:beta-galactosidase